MNPLQVVSQDDRLPLFFLDSRYVVDFSGDLSDIYGTLKTALRANPFLIRNNQGDTLYGLATIFKLRAEYELYSDKERSNCLFTIQTKQNLTYSPVYSVLADAEVVAMFQRKGLRSIVCSEWDILDLDNNKIGFIIERNKTLAILRRVVPFLFHFFPALVFEGYIFDADRPYKAFEVKYYGSSPKVYVDLPTDKHVNFDRRLSIAAAILLCSVECRYRAD